MRGRWVSWALCLVLAGCANTAGPKSGGCVLSGVPEVTVGQTVPEVNFSDHGGRLRRLGDYTEGWAVLLVFIPQGVPGYDNCMEAIRSVGRTRVRFVQVVYDPDAINLQRFNMSMAPKRMSNEHWVALVDPRGLLRRELGICSQNQYVALDPNGVVLDLADADDLGRLRHNVNCLRECAPGKK